MIPLLLFIVALLLLLPKSEKKDEVSYIARNMSAVFHVPTELILAVIEVESNFDINALGRDGEYGLMQILCPTAQSLGFQGSCYDLFNPYVNVYYGTKYLSNQYSRYGDWSKAISAYNAGVATSKNEDYIRRVIRSWRKRS